MQRVYVTFTDNRSHPFGEDVKVDAAKRLADDNNAWGPWTYGHVQFTNTLVAGYLDLPIACGQANPVTLGEAVNSTLGVIPARTVRQYLGSGTCGNAETFGTFNSAQAAILSASYEGHELGHALGLGHAHARHQNGASVVDEDYGDHYDVMGQGCCGPNASVNMWFDADHRIDTIETSQTVRLDPYESQTAGLKAVMIVAFQESQDGNAVSAKPEYYYLEYRTAFQNQAVLVHGFGSWLVDLDPGPADKWTLDVGHPWTPTLGLRTGMVLETLSVDAAGATIRITLFDPLKQSAP